MPNEPAGDRRQRLRGGGVEVLLEIPPVGLPRVVHWGADPSDALAAAGIQSPLLRPESLLLLHLTRSAP